MFSLNDTATFSTVQYVDSQQDKFRFAYLFFAFYCTFAGAKASAQNMDTFNYLQAVKNGQLHFADGSTQTIPHWEDTAWVHFFCVRHAEKADDDPYDPELSAQGDARAEHLGRIMADAGLDEVYATPTQRTRLTAEPVCRRGNTPPIQTYETADQDEWILELIPNSLGKKIMIVGHQHNIPHLLNQLIGHGFDYEHISGYDYGRFFVVATQGIGKTEIIEVRY